MINKKFGKIFNNDRWFLFLFATWIFSLFVTLKTFYPGYMSPDSLFQYMQASKNIPFSDWHPPVLSIFWFITIELTGSWKAFSLFLITIATTCFLIISLKIYKDTLDKRKSLYPFILLFSPFIFSILGVIWKDVFLAIGLLLFVTLLYTRPAKSFRLATLYAAVLIIALTSRHNSLVLALPGLGFLSYCLEKRRNIKLLFFSSMLVISLVAPLVLNYAFHVQKDHVEVAVMLDDIQNLNNNDEIYNSQLPNEAKLYIGQINESCDRSGVENNSLFLCTSDLQFSHIARTYHSEIRSYWIKTIIDKPYMYLKVRLSIYKSYLRQDYPYVWQERIDNNPYGLVNPENSFSDRAENYVRFAMKDFGFLFMPYFWIFLTLMMLVVLLKNKIYLRGLLVYMNISSLLYLLAYIPSVIVFDYRMTYPSALLTSISVVLFCAYRNNNKLKNIKSVNMLKSVDVSNARDIKMTNNFTYTGTDILEVLEDAKNYNAYLIQLILSASLYNKKKNRTYVDFGAGTGTFAKMLPIEKNAELICVELDGEQRKMMQKQGLKTSKGLKSIKNIDVLYSLNVFEHIEDDGGVMKMVANNMSKGGVVLVYVPANQILYSSMDKLVEHYRRYDKKRLRYITEEAGLEVLDLRFVDPLGYFAAMLYKLIDKGDGKISPLGVKIFDRFVFPISKFLEPLTKSFLGKNLVVTAVKR